jgi:hypothetical protein
MTIHKKESPMSQIQVKTLPISALPSGYYKTQLTQLARTPEANVIVVAKEGGVEDWACYIGWPKREDSKPEFANAEAYGYYFATLTHPEGVLSNGDKLSVREARFLFPEPAWEKRIYRS